MLVCWNANIGHDLAIDEMVFFVYIMPYRGFWGKGGVRQGGSHEIMETF